MRLDALGKFDGNRIDVDLKVSGNSMTVRNLESMAYGGLLSQTLAKPLIEIIRRFRVTLVAFIAGSAEKKSAPQTAHSYRLCIKVYGMQEASTCVGEVLDDAGIYLQHPTLYDPTVSYINPHYLVRPGGAHPDPSLKRDVEFSTRPSVDLSTDRRLEGEVIQIINSSAQGPLNYSQITPSSQMLTALKP